MDSPWQSKNLYLSHPKEKDIIGLHAVGDYDENGAWHNMEAWINMYNKDREFKYSAARLFGPIENTANDFFDEGWRLIPDWKEKECSVQNAIKK